MTSSQPVVTPQALNFTPDNKHVYANSGLIAVNNVENTLLEILTNTEYIVGRFNFFYASDNSDNYLYSVYFNDVKILAYVVGDADNHFLPLDVPLLIPPFTNVKFTADNISDSSSTTQAVTFIGQAFGMTETGFQ